MCVVHYKIAVHYSLHRYVVVVVFAEIAPSHFARFAALFVLDVGHALELVAALFFESHRVLFVFAVAAELLVVLFAECVIAIPFGVPL